MKKNVTLLMLVSILLTGCGLESECYIDDQNKVVKAESVVYVTEEEYPSVDEENHTYTKIDLNGEPYYRTEVMSSEDSWSSYNNNYDTMTDDTVIVSLDDPTRSKDYDFLNLRVHFPFDIAYTNGEVLDDRYVLFNGNKVSNMIATSRSEVIHGENISLRNVTKNKAIKNNSILGISMLADNKYRLLSNDSLFLSAKLSYGEDYVDVNPYVFDSPIFNMPCVERDGQLEIVGVKNGKYTLTATLVSGYEKSFTYYIDTQRPTVTIKNRKVYCKDKKINNYASGIKSVKVNGKTMKSNYKVKSGDRIVVTDKAGNKTVKEIK